MTYRTHDVLRDKVISVTRIVKVGDNEIQEEIERVPVWGLTTDWNLLKDQYKNVVTEILGNTTISVVMVPEEQSTICTVVNKDTKPKPMMCLYNATADYCKRVLGVDFSTEDREFFEAHPLTNSDGVPFPDTLRVVQELVEPYGLRVSRVQLSPGYPTRGDMNQWKRVLGINPLGMSDRMTTNHEYYEQAPGDLGVYNFEYTKTALHPSVSCGTTSDSTVAGSFGGHAVYIPARQYASNAILSFQIDRTPFVLWKKQPVFTPIAQADTPPKEERVFDLDEWYKKHRKYVPAMHTGFGSSSNWEGNSWNGVKHSEHCACNKCKAVVNTKKQSGLITKYISPYDQSYCEFCKKHKTPTNGMSFREGVGGICDECWFKLMKNAWCTNPRCKDCGVAGARTTDGKSTFRYVEFSWASQSVQVQCRSCYRDYWIGRKYGKVITKALRCLEHYRTKDVIDTVIAESVQPSAEVAPTQPPLTGHTSDLPDDEIVGGYGC